MWSARSVLWDNARDRVRGGELHLLVDRVRPHLESALEDAGEGKHLVDLVRPSERPVAMMATSSRTSSGWPSGTGLAIPKTDRAGGHRTHPGGGPRSQRGYADQHVGAGQHPWSGVPRSPLLFVRSASVARATSSP